MSISVVVNKSVRAKLRGEEPVAVTSSFTDAELFAHVDRVFPDLSGPLAELVRRFGIAVREDSDIFPADAVCPACGTHIDIVLE